MATSITPTRTLVAPKPKPADQKLVDKVDRLELETLLGAKMSVRWDPESRLVSVYDVIRVILSCETKRAYISYKNLPDYIRSQSEMHKFWCSAPTPVANMNTILDIVMALPGKASAEFRRHCTGQIRRLLAGDVSLIPEIEQQSERISPALKDALMGDLQQPSVAPIRKHAIDDTAAQCPEVIEKRRKVELSNLDNQLAGFDMQLADLNVKQKQLAAESAKLETDSARFLLMHQLETFKEIQTLCGTNVNTDSQAKIEMKDLTGRLYTDYTNTVRNIRTHNTPVGGFQRTLKAAQHTPADVINTPPPTYTLPINQPMVCTNHHITYIPRHAARVGKEMKTLFAARYNIDESNDVIFDRHAPKRDVLHNNITRKERTYYPKDADLMFRAITNIYRFSIP